VSRLPLSAHRWLYGRLMRLQRSFPVDIEHATDDRVRSCIFYLTHGHHLRPPAGRLGSSIAHVRSHFARLGLLDDQVREGAGGRGGGDLEHVRVVAIRLLDDQVRKGGLDYARIVHSNLGCWVIRCAR
jgi:hypothetical protein